MTIDYETVAREQRGMLVNIASEYYAPGLGREDLLQEASIGLWKACRDYRPEAGVPFKAFAVICVRRQIITAVKTATRAKHGPLNFAMDLDSPANAGRDSGDALLREVIAGPGSAADEVAERRQAVRDLQAAMARLSPLERDAVLHVANGGSYSAAGDKVKSLDNALQRARRKLAAAA